MRLGYARGQRFQQGSAGNWLYAPRKDSSKLERKRAFGVSFEGENERLFIGEHGWGTRLGEAEIGEGFEPKFGSWDYLI